MVRIHGGGFLVGSSNFTFYGPNYLLDKDIILVSINYRLGILGFFSTGDSVVPGNFGLKDQVLALKWVQNNIRVFGGDPNRVTLFGESAGGACVSLHALSDLSNGNKCKINDRIWICINFILTQNFVIFRFISSIYFSKCKCTGSVGISEEEFTRPVRKWYCHKSWLPKN